MRNLHLMLAAATFLLACDNHPVAIPKTNPPPEPVLLNVDSLLARTLPANLSEYVRYVGDNGMDEVAPATIRVADCAAQPTEGTFVCPAITDSGTTPSGSYKRLTRSGSYRLLDALGQPLSTPDSASLATVHTAVTISGLDSYGNFEGSASAKWTQTSTQQLSGLLEMSQKVSGSTVYHWQRSAVSHLDGPNSRTYGADVDLAVTVTNVVLPARTSTTKYPASGTITVDYSGIFTAAYQASHSVDTVTYRQVLTFDGTKKVIVTRRGGQTLDCWFEINVVMGIVCQP